ncbi:MAG: leucine-rich repeat domain-containing protein [Hormoscilla sp. GUM202]|nr:leucine-rich repeat domain-containing protein [Hormoscilla sp. GUM202]
MQELYLSKNQISSISEVLGQLTGLQELNLSRNQISSIPKSSDNSLGCKSFTSTTTK